MDGIVSQHVEQLLEEKEYKKWHLVGFSYPHGITMHGQPHIRLHHALYKQSIECNILFPLPVLQGQACAMVKFSNSSITSRYGRFPGGPQWSMSAAWWNCRLESRRGHDNLFSVNVVFYPRSVRRTDPSSRGILPCHWVWSGTTLTVYT